MADKKISTAIIGFAIFVTFVIILFAIFYLQGFALRQRTKPYQAAFSDVGLLQAGDKVKVAGVSVGRVDNIRLAGNRAVAEFLVTQGVDLHSGASVTIRIGDVFGEAYLELNPEIGGEVLDPGSEIEGRVTPGLPQIMDRSTELMERAYRLLDKSTEFVESLDRTLGDSSSFPQTMDNLAAISADVRDLSKDLDKYERMISHLVVSADSAVTNVNSLVQANERQLSESLASLSSFAARLDSLSLDISHGQGTLGRLARDESLYEDMRDLSWEIKQLIADIRANPKKYFNVEVF